MNTIQAIEPAQLKAALKTVRHFMGRNQYRCICDLLQGEEREWFAERMVELAAQLLAMPKIYEQEGLGNEAVAHLHYFTGSADWWIIERDTTEEQLQAFGLADLFRDGGEVGYISIPEITECGAELDLHWTTKTLREVRDKS